MPLNHHAYFVEGPAELLSALESDLKEKVSNAELLPQTFQRFGVDEARALREQASLTAAAGKMTVFIVAATSMTSEAQNALLKLLEEPRQDAIFILLIPHGTLLATLRSRCLPYPAELSARQKTSAKEFLAATPTLRSEMVTKLLKDEDAARESARALLNGLETELYKKISNPEARRSLEDIGRFRSYLADRAPSLKMLLEHLAATAPQLI